MRDKEFTAKLIELQEAIAALEVETQEGYEKAKRHLGATRQHINYSFYRSSLRMSRWDRYYAWFMWCIVILFTWQFIWNMSSGDWLAAGVNYAFLMLYLLWLLPQNRKSQLKNKQRVHEYLADLPRDPLGRIVLEDDDDE